MCKVDNYKNTYLINSSKRCIVMPNDIIYNELEIGGKIMISQTLEQTMSKAMKIESMIGEKVLGCYPLNRTSLIKKSDDTSSVVSSKMRDNDILDYIVENPDDVIPIFKFNTYNKTDLPFFKSISKKLLESFS